MRASSSCSAADNLLRLAESDAGVTSMSRVRGIGAPCNCAANAPMTTYFTPYLLRVATIDSASSSPSEPELFFKFFRGALEQPERGCAGIAASVPGLQASAVSRVIRAPDRDRREGQAS